MCTPTPGAGLRRCGPEQMPASGYAFSVTSAPATALRTGRFSLNLTLTLPLGTAAGYPAPAA